jgi:hypothetical protein
MENKQQPAVNICGSCILRDAFYYQGVYGKEKDGGYRINRYEKPTASCCVETVGFLMMIDFSNYFYGFFSSKSYTV